jgi:hypothetical protein
VFFILHAIQRVMCNMMLLALNRSIYYQQVIKYQASQVIIIANSIAIASQLAIAMNIGNNTNQGVLVLVRSFKGERGLILLSF